jgi:hydroxymethylpyrimidine pyrophosphatase-like HAD family hydrolase
VRFRVLAFDYDGTIAEDGMVPPDVGAAIQDARAQGIAILLVTGRRLDDLRRVAGDLGFADAVVAEGGAVVLYPESNRCFALAGPPSSLLLEDLRRLEIRAEAGQSIIEADASLAPVFLELIRSRELPLAILFNRDRLMVLPQAVSKATGLRNALATLRLSAHNAVGIGDAENDHALLEACEVGVAVGWGSPALQAAADEVLAGPRPGALAAYIRRLAGRTRLPPDRGTRRSVLLGADLEGGPVFLPMHGRNVLVAGDPGSGKSWITGLLCEQLILAHYSVCVVDPEGDYTPLESLPGVVVLGHETPPTLREVERAVRFPDVSVVVDLSAMPAPERAGYVPALLEILATARRQRGFPHRIVVDEAHCFLHGPSAAAALDLELAGYTLATYKVSHLDPRILRATETIVLTKESDPAEARALHALAGGREPEEHWREALAGLAMNEAASVTIGASGNAVLRPFRVASRLTPHVRHRHKYTDVPVPAREAFVFTWQGKPIGRSARTLNEFSALLEALPPGVLVAHLKRHDFSRWIATVYRDRALAALVRNLEKEHKTAAAADTGIAPALARVISDRYFLAGEVGIERRPAIVSIPA